MGRTRTPRPTLVFSAILGIGLATAVVLAWAQKPPSSKDLVRMAEADQKNNRWEAAWEKLRQAAAQKPKDKKIAIMLQDTGKFLADQAATKALTLCEQRELEPCEKEVKTAASYATTPRVQEAQARLDTRKKEVQEQWNRVQQMIGSGQLVEANLELQALTRFSYLLPNLAAEKERVRQLRVESFLGEGRKEAAAQRWDAAMEAFSAALRLDAGNQDAARGIESAKQEKEASTAFQQAQNAVRSKAYQVAYEANQKALRVFPNRQPYQELAKQIASDWSKALVEESKTLSSNPDNQKDNQRALDALEWARRLDPKLPGLAEEVRTIRLTLHSIYLQRAGEYESLADNSRIGIAYAYYLAAQQTNPGGEFALGAKMRETNGVFSRKRAVQILINVENVSPAPPDFAKVVAGRVRRGIEKLSLPDVKLRSLDEYQKNPAEDPQFVENRPDGKSPTVLFTVDLTNYESETTGSDKPLEKPSRYVSGQEMAPNPEYRKLQDEFNKVSLALSMAKPGKPSKEGYTTYHLQMLQQQVSATPRETARDRIADYTYQEFHLGVRALIRMNLELRDMLEKQLLGQQLVETNRQQSQVEIAGVREKDVNHLTNKPARLPSAEQLLRECERNTLELLDEKVRLLVSQYLNRFYAEGEKALREGRTEDALENFLCHWHSFRGRLEESQSRRIRELVKREMGLDLSAAGNPHAAL